MSAAAFSPLLLPIASLADDGTLADGVSLFQTSLIDFCIEFVKNY
jgi:hypothetical protein